MALRPLINRLHRVRSLFSSHDKSSESVLKLNVLCLLSTGTLLLSRLPAESKEDSLLMLSLKK